MAEIQHFSHKHSLKSRRSLVSFRICRICNGLINYKTIFYRYLRCGYYIHKTCAELSQHINHSLHEVHPLTLKRSSHESTICCYYCEKPFGDEFAYTCNQCALYMHITCALIPLPTITCDDGEDHGIVQFACHQHQMTLVENGGHRDVEANKCFACQLPWSSPAYSCTTCENFLHKSCEELPQKIQRFFNSRHSLTLQVSKPQSCDFCFKKDCRLIFSCQETGYNFKMCTECASLGTTVKCQSHDHLLSLVEKASSDNIKCDACQKSYKQLNYEGVILVNSEVHRTQSFLFCGKKCNFNLHFLCGPLPFTIKYDYHIHSLTLVDSLIEDIDSDEYCCDVCEEKKDSQFRVYNCADCKYVVHIHCIIPEIMKIIKGEIDTGNDVELWTFGESRWKLGIDVTDKANKTNKRTTLREIFDSLTQEEKDKLIHPVGNMEVTYRNAHEYHKKLNSRFDQLGSIENFDRVKEFFQINSSELVDNFEEEFVYYVPEEGLKIDEKYLRQEVVELEGNYMVPKTLAPILKTLLHKYGDLGGKSSLTREMKSIGSSLLSMVIDKMGRTKVEDVTMDDLNEWYFYIDSIREITGFKVEQYIDSFEEFILPAFLGCKGIRHEKEIPEKLDLRIKTLEAERKRCEAEIERFEAEIERCEETREKLKTYTSQKSDRMKGYISLASKWKRRNVSDKWF